MADLFRKEKSLYASTANTFGTGTSVTITPASVSGLPTDTEITLTFDRVNSSGTATPSAMERIIGVISGGNFVPRLRGADGTSDAAHTSPVVELIHSAKDTNDLVDGILVNQSQTGHLKSGAQIDDTSADHQYVLAVSELTADRTVTLPLLTGADEFVFKAHTQTFTNKRITPRVVTTTDDATAVIDVDITDQYQLTAIANATTFTVTGTPVAGQKLIVRLKDAGVAKALTWTGFTSKGATLPTTTVVSKTHYIGLIYNLTDTTWDCVAATVEA